MKKNKYYEIKVSIKNTHPPVWRRLQIPSGITFHELSAIIQLAFDWSGQHMYGFEIPNQELGQTLYIEHKDECDFNDAKESTKIKIDKYFQNCTKMKYVYDFGDQWEHEIVIEKIVETEEPLENPKCIKAKMASLPEDCGGTYGYDRLLKILSNPEDSEYQEMVEWIEENTYWNEDRDYVDIEEISGILEDYKEHAEFLLDDFMM